MFKNKLCGCKIGIITKSKFKHEMVFSGLFAFNTTTCIVKNRNFSKDLNDVNFHVGYQDFFFIGKVWVPSKVSRNGYR